MLPRGLSREKSVPETKTQMTLTRVQLIGLADEGPHSRRPIQEVFADATGPGLDSLLASHVRVEVAVRDVGACRDL